MRFFAVISCLLCVSCVAMGADFVVTHGSASKILDGATEILDYASANDLSSGTAPGDLVGPLLDAEKVALTIVNLGSDPTGAQKVAGLASMDTLADCKQFRDMDDADLENPPACFLVWVDTSVVPADCQNLVSCGVPGSQLCNILSAEHTMVKRNLAGTRCTSACQNPSVRLRITCN